MDSQLEEIREIWANAFYSGDYDLLRHYEHQDFQVIFEQEGHVEGSYLRYDRIAHAVQNSVWKPLKPEIEYEEYEYNEDQTECRILIGLENNKQRLQEIWKLEDEWKILELRFLKS
ncbi:hypothetical protein EGK58_000025 [Acinetobacter variabilis]|uniref:hypothetical protein n=1 Tax=Acinetobacter TaxID=469 RepID=UPI0004504C89|nr:MULTISPECIES: hypothetical protein [Acinetobacter]EXA63724.1 hypothetical protein J504_2934 [Acinetobacter baumannii 348935]QXR19403.1 hypothetical protein EGK58_000025 [Acinetobacter variabilis]